MGVNSNIREIPRSCASHSITVAHITSEQVITTARNCANHGNPIGPWMRFVVELSDSTLWFPFYSISLCMAGRSTSSTSGATLEARGLSS